MLGKYIFLVVKVDVSKSEDEFYQRYRADALKALKGAEMDQSITAIAAGYTIVKKDKIIDKIYETVSAVN
jgi:hypothetical protein